MTTLLYVIAAIAVFWGGPVTGYLLSNSVFPVVGAILITFKLTGTIDASWWWVMLPMWGYPSALLARFFIVRRNAPVWSSPKPLGFTIASVIRSIVDTTKFAIIAAVAVGAWSFGEFVYDPRRGYHISAWSLGGGILASIVWLVWHSLRPPSPPTTMANEEFFAK